MNDVVTRSRNKSKDAVTTVPKREIFIVLPYLGFHSKVITQQLKSCIYKFLTLKLFFETLAGLSLFFPYKDRLSRSLMSKVVYKASCWDCDDFYIGKTKRRLHDRKTGHFKALTHAIADHMSSTGHNIKWDHFEILTTGRSDIHCPRTGWKR